MSTDYGYLLGYGGYGKFEHGNGTYVKEGSSGTVTPTGTPISLLNGNVMCNLQVPMTTPYYLDLNDAIDISSTSSSPSTGTGGDDGNKAVASKIRMGYGTYSFNGNITFELTSTSLSGIFTSSFFQRNHLFNLYMSDGEQGISIKNNVWNSVTFNYASQQIPTCSIGFMSNNGGLNDLNIAKDSHNSVVAESDDELIPYWESGASSAEIESFNISFSRNVSNVYLNGNLKVPSYMRVGLIELSLSITAFDINLSAGLNIYLSKNTYLNIPNSTIKEVMQSKAYNISGLNSAGMRTFTLTGIRDKPTESIFYFKSE